MVTYSPGPYETVRGNQLSERRHELLTAPARTKPYEAITQRRAVSGDLQPRPVRNRRGNQPTESRFW